MLLQMFFVPLFSFLNFILGLFPTLALPTDMVSYIQTAFGLIASLGAVIPLGTVRNVLSVIIAFYGIQFLFSLSNFTFRKIPTIS